MGGNAKGITFTVMAIEDELPIEVDRQVLGLVRDKRPAERIQVRPA
jgi:hypothetical protein